MTYNFRFGVVWQYQDQILSGLALTLQFSLVAIISGLVIGILVAAMNTTSLRFLRIPAQVYIEAIRNTPLLVQIFIVFFGLPAIGIRLSANTAAMIALSVNLGAYTAEIIRAGIESIHRSQTEAGRALGMTVVQTFRHVVLFQAVKAIYPALTSQFVLLILATSIVSSIGAGELFHQAAFIESRTYRSFEAYAFITISYLALTFGFRALFAVIYRLVFIRRRRA